MDISEVASRSGLSTATLRYYERRGLVASSGRAGNRRQFDDGVLERLALISLGQSAGFSLDEIAEMFVPDGQPRIDRDALVAKATEIDETVGRLVAMRDGLLHASRCPAPSHMECRSFRRLLHLAATGSLPRPPARLRPRRQPVP
jgi:DNA-binding transcriptional MerR regulator